MSELLRLLWDPYRFSMVSPATFAALGLLWTVGLVALLFASPQGRLVRERGIMLAAGLPALAIPVVAHLVLAVVDPQRHLGVALGELLFPVIILVAVFPAALAMIGIHLVARARTVGSRGARGLAIAAGLGIATLPYLAALATALVDAAAAGRLG